MTNTKTHISSSGKVVPCNATKRACNKGGHKTSSANAVQPHKSKRPIEVTSEQAKLKGSKWERMTSEQKALYEANQTIARKTEDARKRIANFFG